MKSVIATFCAALLLSACAQQPIATVPVAGSPTAVDAIGDPQQCASQAECTTKTSRTLLFVFDYAAAGGTMVQRRERLLFTPSEAAPSDWPAIQIRLAEPRDSRFEFAAECRVANCRYDAAQLLRVYRSYLADQPCSLLLDGAIGACGEVSSAPLRP
ncbi:hypothetical protein [Pseudomonas sp. BMS12]|uniref:hypothetical protein n=1 Tax=Pseudomonas sp. BMS12 TaxID=1796033 RepID=UPI00083B56D2|nr:hypothetical protein [Pseudomonas sp. BMS12]